MAYMFDEKRSKRLSKLKQKWTASRIAWVIFQGSIYLLFACMWLRRCARVFRRAPRQSIQAHDPRHRRVHPPIPHPCVAQGLAPHPTLRLVRQEL